MQEKEIEKKVELSAQEELLAMMQDDIFLFFYEAWGVRPQKPKAHAKFKMQELFVCDLHRFEEIAMSFTLDDFEPFIKGEHITWQQVIILIAYFRGYRGELPRRMAILTGKGLGKSRITSMIIYHFLYTNPKPIVSVTAPTEDQLLGALHKEANQVFEEMKQPYKSMFEWSSHHVRRTDLPYTYFSRCKTANTISALRGQHSDQQMAIADEATGVMDEIIHNGWSTMTTEDKFMILISNYEGKDYTIERVFEDKDDTYIKLNFNSLQSPIVDRKSLEERRDNLIKKGIQPEKDRDWNIDVLGTKPPSSATIAGYYRLFSDELIEKVLAPVSELESPNYKIRPAFGVDPAGEGKDNAAGVLRSFKWAKLVFEQAISTTDTIAGAMAVVFQENPLLLAPRTFVDSFGVGHKLSQVVLANSSEENRLMIVPLLVGERPEEPYNDRYLNVRAMLFDTMKVWFENGGRIETDDISAWKKELRSIYAKPTATKKLQIMGKAEMDKNKLASPGRVDALSLTFFDDCFLILEGLYRAPESAKSKLWNNQQNESFNPHTFIPM